MINGKSILAIIPARAGSKRLPGKNVLELQGKPLITYSIQAALQARYLDEVIVSTDCHHIAEISEQCGAKIPYLRPPEISDDKATTFSVVEHALAHYQCSENRKFDYVVLLQPTSPLRTSEDIDQAIRMLIKKQADAIVSVCPTEHSPLWAGTLPDDLSLHGFIKEEVLNKRSQDLPQYYRLNGALYICDITRLKEERTFFVKDKIYAYVMPAVRSVDIDTLLDFKLCELILSDDGVGL